MVEALMIQADPALMIERRERARVWFETLRDKIHADVVAVLQDPQVREKFATFAFQPITWEVPEMEKFARTKADQYKLLIQKANISLD